MVTSPMHQFKMRRILSSCWLSIFLFSSTLNIHHKSTRGGFPVAFAEPASRTAIARGILRNTNYLGDDSIAASYGAYGTIARGYDDSKDNQSHCRLVDNNSRECSRIPCTSSSLPLCLRPLTARSGVYLRTLYRHFDWEADGEYDDDGEILKDRNVDFCWESVRNSETRMESVPLVSSFEPVHDSAITIVISNDELRSLALRLDLLFASMKVQNNEILLPQTLADIFSREKVMPHPNTPEEDMTNLPGNRSDAILSSSTASTMSHLEQIMARSSRADTRVDLTGRWRPSKTLSAQDLTDYDEFLKACCSDKLSYWTRQLLTSSSIVSRQECVVKQLEEGRILEFVDIHPMSSNVWNRTIMTGEKDDVSIDSHQSYVNRLKDFQGNPVLIEAYWQGNGTVHTSLLRKDVESNDVDFSADPGWLETSRYLYSGENDVSEAHDDSARVMVVETTYHSNWFPQETEALVKALSKRKDGSEADKDGNGQATRMVWKWEEVIEPSS